MMQADRRCLPATSTSTTTSGIRSATRSMVRLERHGVICGSTVRSGSRKCFHPVRMRDTPLDLWSSTKQHPPAVITVAAGADYRTIIAAFSRQFPFVHSKGHRVYPEKNDRIRKKRSSYSRDHSPESEDQG